MECQESSPLHPDFWSKSTVKGFEDGLQFDEEDTTLDDTRFRRSHLGSHPRSRSMIPSYWLLSAVALISLLLGVFAATLASHIRMTHRNHNNPLSTSQTNDPNLPRVNFMQPACGSTPSEARAAGCLFDIFSFTWLPPQCHDAELAVQFEGELSAAGLMVWYEDAQHTRLLPKEQVAAGNISVVYVHPDYHRRHCTAMWRRMNRALMQGGGGLNRLDAYAWSYNHTMHCEQKLLAGREHDDMAGPPSAYEVKILYPECGVVLEA